MTTETKDYSGAKCSSQTRFCTVCWYGPECGPFYGWERTTIDTERPCPCECHSFSAISRCSPKAP